MTTGDDNAELKGISSTAWSDRAALAEWRTAEGDVGRIIVQLRQRGRAARRNGYVFLTLLVALVLLGIGYYVVLPIYERYLNAERNAWDAQIEAQDQADKTLDEERQKIVDDLVEALKWRAEVVRNADGLGLSTPIVLPGDAGLIAVGAGDGHILRASPSGDDWREVRAGDDRGLSAPIVLPGDAGLLAVGWRDGHILRASPSGDDWREVWAADGRGLRAPIILPGDAGLLAVGRDDGHILRASPSGDGWREVRAADERGLRAPIVLPGDAGLVAVGGGMATSSALRPAVMTGER